MKKSILLFSAFLLLATLGWSQAPQRNMLVDGMISGMEASIGDLTIDQEDQFINAFNKYVKDSNQGNKQQAELDYQAEVKRIVTPQKYAILSQDPKMKNRPAFRAAAPMD